LHRGKGSGALAQAEKCLLHPLLFSHCPAGNIVRSLSEEEGFKGPALAVHTLWVLLSLEMTQPLMHTHMKTRKVDSTAGSMRLL